MEAPKDFVNLPAELRIEIAEYLSRANLAAFSHTSKHAYEVACPLIKKAQAVEEREAKADLIYIWEPQKAPTRPKGVFLYNSCRYPSTVNIEDTGIPKLRILIKACEAGDIQGVQALLDEGVSPNLPEFLSNPLHRLRAPMGFRKEFHYYTPLQAATHFNRTDVVRALLAAGAKPSTGFESFAYLFCMGHPNQDTLDLLINHGFNIQATRPEGHRADSLLHWACRNSCPAVAIGNLINNGVSIRAPNHASESPISIAIGGSRARGSRRYYEVIRELLSHASHEELQDSYGNYPLHLALRCDDANIVRMMVQEFAADPNVQDAKGRTPLWLALDSAKLNSDIIRFLLEAGASLDILRQKCLDFERFWPPYGKWPISPETLRIVLDTAVHQSIPEHLPHPFVCLAAIMGDAGILESTLSLFQNDIYAHQRNKHYILSAFSYALDWDRGTCLEVLAPYVLAYEKGADHAAKILYYYLKHGTDKEVRDWLFRGECALFGLLTWKEFLCAAMRHQPPDILSMLLSRNRWQPNIPLLIATLREAVEIGSIECLAILLEHPHFKELFLAEECIILHAAEKSRTEVLKFLYDRCSKSNSKGLPSQGRLIQMACKTGNLSNVRWLLESEVAVDIYEGLEPRCPDILLDAVIGGHTEIVELLIAHNADVNETHDYSGETALHFAVSGGHADITRLLLGAGANPHKPDKRMVTPLCQVVKELNERASGRIYKLCSSGEATVTAEWFQIVFEPRIQCIWALVEHGAELNKEWLASTPLFGGDGLKVLEYSEDDEDLDKFEELRRTFSIRNMGPEPSEIWLQYLKKGPAALDAVDQLGRTLFLFAVLEMDLVEGTKCKRRELLALLHLLTLAGCDTSKANNEGRTPLHIATTAGDDELVKLLYAAR